MSEMKVVDDVDGEKLSSEVAIVMAACVFEGNRVNVLRESILSLRSALPDALLIVGFDKRTSKNVPSSILDKIDSWFDSDRGLGWSFNHGCEIADWCGRRIVLQTEDDWVLTSDFALIHIYDALINVRTNTNTIFRLTHPLVHMEAYPNALYALPGRWERIVKPENPDISEPTMYVYTNHPHIKSIEMCRKMRYLDNNDEPWRVELDMCKQIIYMEDVDVVCPKIRDVSHHMSHCVSNSGNYMTTKSMKMICVEDVVELNLIPHSEVARPLTFATKDMGWIQKVTRRNFGTIVVNVVSFHPELANVLANIKMPYLLALGPRAAELKDPRWIRCKTLTVNGHNAVLFARRPAFVPIGDFCLCAQVLKDARLREASLATDWIFSNVDFVADCLKHAFVPLYELIYKWDGIKTTKAYRDNPFEKASAPHINDQDEDSRARSIQRWISALTDQNACPMLLLHVSGSLVDPTDVKKLTALANAVHIYPFHILSLYFKRSREHESYLKRVECEDRRVSYLECGYVSSTMVDLGNWLCVLSSSMGEIGQWLRRICILPDGTMNVS